MTSLSPPIAATSSPAAEPPPGGGWGARLDRLRRRRPYLLIALAAFVIYAGVCVMIVAGGEAPLRFRPGFAPLLAAPLMVQLHVAGAVTAFAIGCMLLTGVKGTRLHRTLGYLWVGAMLLAAVTSFFLKSINPGQYSPIHALSGWVVIAAPLAIAFARTGRMDMHRRFMTGLFTGGLLIAGLFSFLPGRLMWSLFFAD